MINIRYKINNFTGLICFNQITNIYDTFYLPFGVFVIVYYYYLKLRLPVTYQLVCAYSYLVSGTEIMK
jgi:hypothetical protein